MVVDDEEGVRLLLEEQLQAAGHCVLTAANGPEALRIENNYDNETHLLLTDVVMPGMNGRELADELTARRPTLEVLYMSGYASDDMLRHGVTTRSTALLRKPFTLKELERSVQAKLAPQHTQTASVSGCASLDAS
jgi:CheY-like chemotaxis protein